MKIVYQIKDWDEKAVIATIGFFDGVHPGHCFLLQEMQHLASQRHIPSAVITFPVHPRVVLNADYQPKLLNSFDEKLSLLSETGIDYIIVMDFKPALAAMTAREFIGAVLVPQWHVRTLIVGYNHRFGYHRTEGFENYVLDGKDFGLEVIQTSSFSADKDIAVSSSMIRRLIEAGDVAAASRLLGYHYRLKGCVIDGNQKGRELGFPTANITVEDKYKVIPRNGSYVVRISIGDKNYDGMLYIGSRPTISTDDSLRIEVHIFDFSEDIYGKSVTVEFIDFIREEKKFTSLSELREQMMTDQRKAKLLGGRNQESGVRSQESGVRNQEAGIRSQESGGRRQESGVRGQGTGGRGQE